MLADRASQRILNWDNGGTHVASLQPVKNLQRPWTWNHGAAWNHPLGGFMAERAQLSLDSNFHGSTLAGLRRRKQIFLQHKGVHAVRIVTRQGLEQKIVMPLIEGQCRQVVNCC